MLYYKQESLIPDIATDEKLNTTADEAINADKRWNTAANKKLKDVANEVVDIDKKWDAIAGK